MTSKPTASLALVLSGGNALGSYQAGAYEALYEAGLHPDWIGGASAGAVNAAIICGNAVEDRVRKLRRFWRPDPAPAAIRAAGAVEEMRRGMAAMATVMMGQPGLFVPRLPHDTRWHPLHPAPPASLYDTAAMRDTLRRLVDFDRLNSGEPRFCVTAVDLETGQECLFDTRAQTLGPDHIRASCALPPAFPPVEIDGRWFVDAGLSANLPLDVVLSDDVDHPLLCIAVDLLPLRGPLPATLGEVMVRTQDLLFAAQSRRSIAAWQTIFDARAAAGSARAVTLVQLSYGDHCREVSGKAFDFSAPSAAQRWAAGRADMTAALAAIADVEMTSGLQVLERRAGGDFALVKHSLTPEVSS